MLTSTHPDLFASPKEQAAFGRLKARARMTRYGGDCYGYCLLAAGFVDVVVEAGLKAHDVAALIPIIESAGGRITTWDNKPALHGGRILAAGDARVHEEALGAAQRLADGLVNAHVGIETLPRNLSALPAVSCRIS